MSDRIGGDNMDQSWIGGTVVRVIILAIGIAVFFSWLTSCCPKIMPGHNDNTNHKDSTSVNIVVKDSLIYVPIPLEKDQVIAHIGDTSKLETSLAKSVAFVGGDGFLHHSLENKSEEKLPVVVPVKTKTIFNGVTHTEIHTLTNYVEVEKELTWWQKFRQNSFWLLSAGLVLCLVWIFRKLIFKIV